LVTGIEKIHSNILELHHEQAYALSKQLKKLKLTTYPSKEITNFINELYLISTKFIDIFDPKNKLEPKKIEHYRTLFIYFQQRVSRIHQTSFSQHPLEVMLPAKEILINFGNNIEFYTEPTWDLNYSIGDMWSDIARYIYPALNMSNEHIEKKISIQFPIIHKDDVLLGCVMGHELGHYFDLHSNLKISENLLPKLLNHPNVERLLNYLEIKHQGTLISFDNAPANELGINTLKTILNKDYLYNWLLEFVADISGVLLYGPASHFSNDSIFKFYGFSSDGKLKDNYANSHPRKLTRSLVRQKIFEYLNYNEKFDKIIREEIMNSHSNWEDAELNPYQDYIVGNIDKDTLYRFSANNSSLSLIENILIENLDLIIRNVTNKIPDNLHYKAETYTTRVPELANRISRLIPPNEDTFGPADSISILNAGWYSYFVYKNELSQIASENDGNLNVREIINNLSKKALTLAYVHRRWIDVSTK